MNRIASTLAEQYDVCIVGTTTRNPPALTKKPYRQKRIHSFFKKGKFFYFEYNLRLFFFLLFYRFDHLYTVDLDTIFAGYLVKKIKKFRWIFDAHEYFTELPELEHRSGIKKIWNKLAKLSIPLTNIRFTVNEALAIQLSEKYNHDFDFIRNMPFAKEVKIHNKDSKIIIYQGAVNVGRGIVPMINAMEHLIDYKLWICGAGPEMEKYMEYVENKHIENVLFLGMKSPEELSEITDQAYIGINLLEGKSLNYYYSLANKFFDYTMSEIPSINMDFPVYRKLNQEFEVSILVDNLKTETLIEAVVKLEDPNRYNTMKSACQKAKKVWNWEMEELRLKELLNSK